MPAAKALTAVAGRCEGIRCFSRRINPQHDDGMRLHQSRIATPEPAQILMFPQVANRQAITGGKLSSRRKPNSESTRAVFQNSPPEHRRKCPWPTYETGRRTLAVHDTRGNGR